MAKEHQEEDSADLATHDTRHKRGRPRKDDIAGSEPYKRTRRCKVDVEAHGNDPFVGQVVSGVLDGKFDAGYMLTVQVGERGSVLRGVVFEPGRSVPISAANDVAPNVKMFKRDEVSLQSFAWQLPSFTPVRSRSDGAVLHHQRDESTTSSKGICTDTIAEDINAKVQIPSFVDVRRLPENGTNHAPRNLKQDSQSTSSDNANKNENKNVEITNITAECPRDIHRPEVGSPSIIASDSTKIVGVEAVTDVKPIIPLSQTISESKKPTMSDGRTDSASDNITVNVQEVVNDIKLITQMPASTSEPKQIAETLDVGSIITHDNESDHLHKIFIDSKPVTELSQAKASECKQSSETSGIGLVFTNGPDDYAKSPSPVTAQSSEHVIEGVVDLGEAPDTTDSSVDESGVQHSVKLALEDGTVEVAEGMNSSVGQESKACFDPLQSECNKPVESFGELLTDNVLTRKIIPEQPQSNSIKVCSGAPSDVTNSSSRVTDVNNGSSKA
uniref:High mobility group B protein 10 n=1 Tax=Anthurium amnicola TaxID=1678845 RepID=A0A1D1XW04_9ARAE